jgi:hypothetical protein
MPRGFFVTICAMTDLVNAPPARYNGTRLKL